MNNLGSEARKELPAGWRWARLGEVIDSAVCGFASGLRSDTGVIQVRMNNVDTNGRLSLKGFIRVPADSKTIANYALVPGDILFNNTNSVELVGKTALFNGHVERVVFSNHFTRIRTRKNLEPEFLSHWLRLQWKKKVFEDLCNRWIGQAAVKNDKLLALLFPLPGVEEQRRIVGILKEKLGAVERARAACDAQLEAARALPAAYLREVFKMERVSGWLTKPLGEICDFLPAKSIASDGEAEVSAITTACLTESGFSASGIKQARMRERDVEQCVVRENEILVARSNTPDLVGRVAMYEGQPENVVASDLTIRLRCKDDADPRFLTSYLSFLYLKGYWKERAGGASGSMKKVTRSQLRQERVPIPAPETQTQIQASLFRYLRGSRTLEKELSNLAEVISHAPAALLRDAFSGRLN